HVITIHHGYVTLQLLVPCTRLDFCPNLLTLRAQIFHGYAAYGSVFVQSQQAVEGSPAQQSRIGVVLSSCARLPDTFVGLTPIPCDVLTYASKNLLCVIVKVAVVFKELQGSVYNLAIHVELQLIAGCVADAYRTRAAVPAEMVELTFPRWSIAIESVGRAQLRPGQRRSF